MENNLFKKEMIGALATRVRAARWVLVGNGILAIVGAVFHIFLRSSRDLSIHWANFGLTASVAIINFFSLRSLDRSLSKTLQLAAWASMFCVFVMLVVGLDEGEQVVPTIFLLHAGVFALGLILGFGVAVRYATGAAVLLLFMGGAYNRIGEMFVYTVLAYVLATPSKFVERLIDESTAELSDLNRQLRQEIEERRRVEEALKRHREHLEEVVQERTVELRARNEELDAFAHTVAHDIQAPLAVIIGFAEMLKCCYADLSGKELSKHLRILERNGQRMRSIVQELMVLAGVRRKEVSPQPLEMANIVSEALSRLSFLIEEYQAEIVVPDDGGWPVALGHGPWVAEVWVNYISNAIRYGGHPPRVQVGFSILDSPVVDGLCPVAFWVRDNGLGLTVEEQARLFTPFTQLSRIRSQGHGLGLSIVWRIVKKLSGHAWVESDGVPGQGSTFYFALPGPAPVLEHD